MHEIKRRMISAAADSWGITVNDMETIDPIIPMLIDACSGELEKISSSIDEVRQKMGIKLMETLTPDSLLSPVPARAILHAQPFEPIGSVNEDLEFYYHKRNLFNNENIDLEIFFTPLREQKLFSGNIKFIACNQSLFRFDEFNQKKIVSNTKSKRAFTGSFWIGLAVNKAIKSFNGLSFYFEIGKVNELHEKMFYNAIETSTWKLNNNEILIQPGYDRSSSFRKDPFKVPYTEFNKSSAITNRVLDFYKKHFITFSDNSWNSMINQDAFTKYPPSFNEYFETKDLEAIESKLLWIQVDFRHYFPYDLLDHIHCSINCFPVINRRKEKSVIQGSDRIKEIKAESHEIFYDLKSLSCDKDIEIVLDEKEFKNQEGKALLTLRKDNIGRMDTTNAIDKVRQLIEAYRNEFAAFSKIKGLGHDAFDKLQETIRPFEYAIENITGYSAESLPYLMLKTNPENENIEVEVIYYLTSGSLGNGLKKGEHLHLDNAEFIRDKIYLMTPSMGGCDSKRDDDMFRNFKYALLTHDRLVTLEDITALCEVQFGKYAESIVVKKGVDVDTQNGSGLRRIIEIQIQMKKNINLAPEEIKFLKEDLDQQLTEKSLNLLSHIIKVL